MTDKKISQLSAASTPLAGTEVLPIVQSSTTVKVAADDLTVKNIRSNATSGILQVAGPAAASTRTMTVPDANFTAARTDAANSFTGDQTLATGNIIQGTAAKGFEFSANTAAAGMTSELLNWYEEGTFTPAISSTGTAPTVTDNTRTGRYTQIGRTVHIAIAINSAFSGGTGDFKITGLPFTPATLVQTGTYAGQFTSSANYFNVVPYVTTGSTDILFYEVSNSGSFLQPAALTVIGAAADWRYITLTYIV